MRGKSRGGVGYKVFDSLSIALKMERFKTCSIYKRKKKVVLEKCVG